MASQALNDVLEMEDVGLVSDFIVAELLALWPNAQDAQFVGL